MMTLIFGGSGSGKSEFAENYIVKLSGEKQKYYIATMQVFDQEAERKVARHKMLRKGKGFLTIEQPVTLENAVNKMKNGDNTALLECISNLTANEMFSGIEPEAEDVVVDKIVTAIESLKKDLTHLVIVSNNVFEDGCVYDDTTMAYIRAMGKINTRLAELADEVIEVVVGIPLFIKKQ